MCKQIQVSVNGFDDLTFVTLFRTRMTSIIRINDERSEFRSSKDWTLLFNSLSSPFFHILLILFKLLFLVNHLKTNDQCDNDPKVICKPMSENLGSWV